MVSPGVIDLRDVVERGPLTGPIPDLSADGEALLQGFQCLVVASPGLINLREVVERGPLTGPIPDLSTDDEALLQSF